VSKPVDRVLTVPNLISFARLLGVPIFLYLFLVPHADIAAAAVLAVGGTSDWIDGWVARRLNQVSRLGELLDPFADRLYIVATLLAFTVRDIVPWQFTAALVARDVAMGGLLALLRSRGFAPPPVHYLGKAATFVLLAAFPLLLLATVVPASATIAGACGWAFAWWGVVLYWVAGALYLMQSVRAMAGARTATATTT